MDSGAVAEKGGNAFGGLGAWVWTAPALNGGNATAGNGGNGTFNGVATRGRHLRRPKGNLLLQRAQRPKGSRQAKATDESQQIRLCIKRPGQGRRRW